MEKGACIHDEGYGLDRVGGLSIADQGRGIQEREDSVGVTVASGDRGRRPTLREEADHDDEGSAAAQWLWQLVKLDLCV